MRRTNNDSARERFGASGRPRPQDHSGHQRPHRRTPPRTYSTTSSLATPWSERSLKTTSPPTPDRRSPSMPTPPRDAEHPDPITARPVLASIDLQPGAVPEAPPGAPSQQHGAHSSVCAAVSYPLARTASADNGAAPRRTFFAPAWVRDASVRSVSAVGSIAANTSQGAQPPDLLLSRSATATNAFKRPVRLVRIEKVLRPNTSDQ